ncbi:hypothetical protein BZJ19_11190 [Salinivibrio proteolyticus]|nr:hypothetical protein BZJ19_11190 [Salinivibrio proteolyticus]
MAENAEPKVCGIVMPISSIDGCAEAHWSEVLEIINEAIDDAGFEGNLVSNADEVGIIHKRIIQNLYDNPVVVCDVSCKNPNVMFELGLRLAFDKPTIIIKDDETSYSFDTSAIEHLEYPRDLRFSQIVEFKQKLSEKIKATFKKATTDQNYTTFLKHFGEFKVAKLEQREVSGQEYILEELKSLRRSVQRMDRTRMSKSYFREHLDRDIDICLGHGDKPELKEMMSMLISHPALRNVGIAEMDEDHHHFFADVKPEFPVEIIQEEVESLIGRNSSKMARKRAIKREAKNG